MVDAYRMMMAHGPRGGNLRDVALGKFMLLSTDPVAVDAVAVKLLQFEEKDVKYLAEAADRKLGEKDLSKLNIKRIELDCYGLCSRSIQGVLANFSRQRTQRRAPELCNTRVVDAFIFTMVVRWESPLCHFQSP